MQKHTICFITIGFSECQLLSISTSTLLCHSPQSIAKAGEKHSQMLCERVDRLQQKHKERTKKHEETLLR